MTEQHYTMMEQHCIMPICLSLSLFLSLQVLADGTPLYDEKDQLYNVREQHYITTYTTYLLQVLADGTTLYHEKEQYYNEKEQHYITTYTTYFYCRC